MVLRKLKSLMGGLIRARDPINHNDRHGALYKAWGYVFNNHLQGDYYEFGVFDGRTFIKSFLIYEHYKKRLRDDTRSSERWRREPALLFADFEVIFYGLDTFLGMPENDEGNPIFARGMFECSLEEVTRRCAAIGLSGKRLKLLKGLFSASTPLLLESNPRPAAIINLDCDLYASAKEALALCQHLIQEGTVLLCDDYNTFCSSPYKGERRALAEFREETGIQFEAWFPYQFCAQAFLCHRES